MGQKGDKNTRLSNLNAEALAAKLEPIGGITSKKMFGGTGLFHDGKMFGMINSKGNIFFKADDTNKGMFQEKNSEKHSKMPYYSLPIEVYENNDLLLQWANTSIKVSK